MTFLQVFLPYEPPLGERQMKALDSMRDVYGIRAVTIDEKSRRFVVEYDASRLTPRDIAFMLRTAGVRLQAPLDIAA
ncbi:MAG TPA: hypothetical protein VMG31_04135 [Verrucomicrobiae bacterium]|nr:hypothetical protein [Verrucomicrobiae bacterium]